MNINNHDAKGMLDFLKMAFPELEELLPLRLNLLNAVRINQPIGRRVLSNTLGLTERVVRRESDILKLSALIDYYPDGMRITEKGIEVLTQLSSVFYHLNGINELERLLQKKLGIKKVIIGSFGHQDETAALEEVGFAAANYLRTLIHPKTIIGLTGGSSIERVINGYRQEWTQYPNNEIVVVPARGGLGIKNEYQANTLAERLSNKLNGRHLILYTQDNLSRSTIDELKNEPNIKYILNYIDKIDVLAFGVGRADVMAARRFLDRKEIDAIISKGAVAESFGYYFNKDGEIVHEISTIGIDLDKFKALDHIIAVAGGAEKAEAIIAISKLNEHLVLVTDEQAAKRMSELL
jgi:central glycolytic genes regulator